MATMVGMSRPAIKQLEEEIRRNRIELDFLASLTWAEKAYKSMLWGGGGNMLLNFALWSIIGRLAPFNLCLAIFFAGWTIVGFLAWRSRRGKEMMRDMRLLVGDQ